MRLILHAFIAMTVASGTPAMSDEAALEPFICATPIAPVISLDHGSRYRAEDKSRSDFDEASNDDVNSQLKPVDDFVGELALSANRAVSTPADRTAAADCVLSGLTVWAQADALSDLSTMNAQLSAPSRIAGLAFAYAQIQAYLDPSEEKALVEAWLTRRAHATMEYFDTDAPKNAARNNLRAWAGLAVARIGLTVGDEALIDWADATVRLVACQADQDGSLPLEMARKGLALHYQLHAVTPLVVSAALLQQRGHDLFLMCDRAIPRAVDFVLAGFDDPKLVERMTGHPQSYFDGTEELRGFELAWAQAYLSVFYAPRLTHFVASFGTLGNSKIGGRQSLLWGN